MPKDNLGTVLKCPPKLWRHLHVILWAIVFLLQSRRVISEFPTSQIVFLLHIWYVARFGTIQKKTWKTSRRSILKLTLLHGCLSCFLNWTNGTKSLKASHIFFLTCLLSNKDKESTTGISWFLMKWWSKQFYNHSRPWCNTSSDVILLCSFWKHKKML